MKIKFTEITTDKEGITIKFGPSHDGQLISKEDFVKVKTDEGAIAIPAELADLNTIEIEGMSKENFTLTFTPQQQEAKAKEAKEAADAKAVEEIKKYVIGKTFNDGQSNYVFADNEAVTCDMSWSQGTVKWNVEFTPTTVTMTTSDKKYPVKELAYSHNGGTSSPIILSDRTVPEDNASGYAPDTITLTEGTL